MPTFTTVAFDRLIEPGASNSTVNGRNSSDSKLRRRRSISGIEIRRMSGIPPIPKSESPDYVPSSPKMERGDSIPPITKLERGVSVPINAEVDRGVSAPPSIKVERGVSVPPNTTTLKKGTFARSRANISRRNGAPTAPLVEKENHWTQISPALYTTPESTPLPDSPSSLSSSPYIINHKRRGPRLMKSFSEYDVAALKNETEESKVGGVESVTEEGLPLKSECKDDISVPEKVLEDIDEKHLSGVCNGKDGSSITANGLVEQNKKSLNLNLHPTNLSTTRNFSISRNLSTSNSILDDLVAENEGNGGAERSLNPTTPFNEFYDAWEELSAESGSQQPLPDIGTELREIRLALLMEIDQRKQAEENLNNLRSQWQKIREHLSLVGLNLPADPTAFEEGEEPADDICQQFYLARFVSNSIGRGMAKAEVEMEMEAQIELKNSEIARLWDRLHYFEAVNQEMSQRNQQVVETARRLRQRRKRRQRWILGSISAALTVGSGFLVYNYLHSGKGSSSENPVSDVDRRSK